MPKFWLSATLLLAVSQLFSRLLGVLRDHLIAVHFGTTGAGANNLDAYFAAFRVPDLVYTLLIFGTLSAAFVPLLAEQKTPADASRLASNTLNVLLVGVAILLAMLAAAAHSLVAVLVPGFTPEAKLLTAELLRIQLLAPFFFTLSAVLGGLAQHLHRFTWYALAPIFYNLGILTGLVFFTPEHGVVGLSWGVALGAGLHAAVQLPTLWRSKIHWQAVWQPRALGQFARLAVPRVVAVVAAQAEFLVLTFFASLVGAGALASFNYAWNLASLPLGVVGLAYATAGFATLSALAGRANEFAARLTRDCVGVLFWSVPAAVGLLILRTEITQLILSGGAFTAADVTTVAGLLVPLSLAVPAFSLAPLLRNAYFAQKNTRLPLVAGLLTLATTAAGSALLRAEFGTLALAGAFAAGAMVGLLFLGRALARQYPLPLAHAAGKVLLAAAGLAATAWPLAHFWVVDSLLLLVVKIAVVTAGGAGVYFAVARKLGLPLHAPAEPSVA